jgi:hypothetical protein
MPKIVFKILFAALAAQFFIAAQASAQATRTWVSGTGSDANPCSRTAPCQTFAGAISNTAAGGEIDVLDAGGFGALTITKAITIRSDHAEAGVLVNGSTAITISVGPSDKVVLFGLDLEGINLGLGGIQINSAGDVLIERCNIHQFKGNGVTIVTNSQVRVTIKDSDIQQNAGSGVVVNSTPGFGHAKIFNTLILSNGADGVQVNGAGNDALLSGDQILGSARSLNTTTGVSGGVIHSYGNNVLTSGDAPTAVPLS